EVEAGTVISADPGEGEEVPVGSTVEVTVSTGPEAADVPDVTDMPREDAEAALEDAGFEPEYVDSEDEEKTGRRIVTRTKHEPGTVLEQTPPGDSSQTIGSTIKLIVAAPEGPVSVPNVTGQPLADARDTLAEAGFGHTTTEEHSDSVEEGRVIRTEPGANEEVDSGTTITIVVSSGPEPTPTEEPSESPTPTPTESESESPTPTETEEPTDDPPSDEPGNGQDDEGQGETGRGSGDGNG